MFPNGVFEEGQAFDPAEVAALRAALQLACDKWDLNEPLTDSRRSEFAATILEAAQVGFSDRTTLATIALDKIRIAAAGKPPRA